ncbi:MAG: hypothetical protein ACI9JM_000287 [Halioglobus sp.]|jgi:hypothetical protein
MIEYFQKQFVDGDMLEDVFITLMVIATNVSFCITGRRKMTGRKLATKILLLLAGVTMTMGCTTKPVIRDYSEAGNERLESSDILHYELSQE